MKTGFICLIVGPSGVGKSSLARLLSVRNGWSELASYTTRAPRYEGEGGHTFITEEEFRILPDLVAYTEYNGHRYGATARQIDANEIYVIDPAGIETLVRNYHGDKKLLVCVLWASEETRLQRMTDRGDDAVAAQERIDCDAEAFADLYRLGLFVGPHYVTVCSDFDLDADVQRIEEFIQDRSAEQ